MYVTATLGGVFRWMIQVMIGDEYLVAGASKELVTNSCQEWIQLVVVLSMVLDH